MEDWGKLSGRLIGIIVLAIHDYVRNAINRRQRGALKRPHIRRLTPLQRRARYQAQRRRIQPYTGDTQRL
jgi:hypothetical protein